MWKTSQKIKNEQIKPFDIKQQCFWFNLRQMLVDETKFERMVLILSHQQPQSVHGINFDFITDF